MSPLSFKENSKALRKSEGLFREEQYEQALEGFKAVLDASEDTLMYANIGYCYQRLEKYELAYQAFQDFVNEWPFKTHGWKAMAYCAYELESYQKMERCALIAIKWDRDLKEDDDEYAWQQLTIAQFLLDKPTQCLNSAWHTLALNPANSYVKYYEACALCHPKTLDLPEAKIALLDAVALTPELWKDAHEEGHVKAILNDDYFQGLTEWFKLTQAIMDDNLIGLRDLLSAYAELPTQGKWTLLDFVEKHHYRRARHLLMEYYDITPPDVEEEESEGVEIEESEGVEIEESEGVEIEEERQERQERAEVKHHFEDVNGDQ